MSQYIEVSLDVMDLIVVDFVGFNLHDVSIYINHIETITFPKMYKYWQSTTNGQRIQMIPEYENKNANWPLQLPVWQLVLKSYMYMYLFLINCRGYKLKIVNDISVFMWLPWEIYL